MTDRAVGETLASRVEAITGFSSTGSEVTGAQRIPSGASTASGRGGTSSLRAIAIASAIERTRYAPQERAQRLLE